MSERGQLFARLALMGLLLTLLASVPAAEIVYKAVAIGEEEEKILLDLLEQYELGEKMVEALESGVPLTFVTEVVLEAETSHFWQAPLAEVVIRRQLRFHPLAGEYEVYDSLTGTRRYFATREAALLALGDIKEVEIISSGALRKGAYYRVSIETWHDIGSLPLPLRPRAYLTPSWHLSSKVYEWRLQP